MKLSAVRERFATDYRTMLDAVMERQLPTAVSTIYDGRSGSDAQQSVNVAALCLFNDVITREAFERGLPVIDLRLICNEPDGYANPIEPNSLGGERMAAAIVNAVTRDSTIPRSLVYTS